MLGQEPFAHTIPAQNPGHMSVRTMQIRLCYGLLWFFSISSMSLYRNLAGSFFVERLILSNPSSSSDVRRRDRGLVLAFPIR